MFLLVKSRAVGNSDFGKKMLACVQTSLSSAKESQGRNLQVPPWLSLALASKVCTQADTSSCSCPKLSFRS